MSAKHPVAAQHTAAVFRRRGRAEIYAPGLLGIQCRCICVRQVTMTEAQRSGPALNCRSAPRHFAIDKHTDAATKLIIRR